MSVLERILAKKRDEVRALRGARDALAERAGNADAPRGFARALRSGRGPRVVAEFKRASPSRGEIRPGADPAEIARAYEGAGAAALSVLTDREFFRGQLDDLRQARGACRLPVLRKDFTIDPLQLLEARAAGADAVLLIVAALDDLQLRELLACAHDLGLDALVEVHDEPELERALAVGAELIGINNRDLRDFKTDVAVTRALLPLAAGRTVVSESGLDSAETLRSLEAAGASAFLIGEALMREPDPGAALRRLRGQP
ncbi:MAG TPA: indole-3-glycerol phosphate synthase TrpC [Myxococcota bacterium]|nr:indole-3-glycerol phosphate synthase TrpC [Myxococcota bacterium]